MSASAFSIVCAWKDMGCPHRRRAFEFTRRYWERVFPNAELVVGASEPFTRARGLNVAIGAATSDMIVQADPDSVAPVGQIIWTPSTPTTRSAVSRGSSGSVRSGSGSSGRFCSGRASLGRGGTGDEPRHAGDPPHLRDRLRLLARRGAIPMSVGGF